MATSMRSSTRLSNHTVLMDERGGGVDPQLVYGRVMELIDEIVLRDAQSFDPEVWRQTVELFDAILQKQFPSHRPVQEHRDRARDGAPLEPGAA